MYEWVLKREGHPLEGVSPSVFPHLKRTHKYKEPPSPTNSSFDGNVRMHKNMRILAEGWHNGLVFFSKWGAIPQSTNRNLKTLVYTTTKTLNPKNPKPFKSHFGEIYHLVKP